MSRRAGSLRPMSRAEVDAEVQRRKGAAGDWLRGEFVARAAALHRGSITGADQRATLFHLDAAMQGRDAP